MTISDGGDVDDGGNFDDDTAMSSRRGTSPSQSIIDLDDNIEDDDDSIPAAMDYTSDEPDEAKDIGESLHICLTKI